MSRFHFDQTAFLVSCGALATAGSAAMVGSAISGVSQASAEIAAASARTAVARRIKADRQRMRLLELDLRAARTDALIQAYHARAAARTARAR